MILEGPNPKTINFDAVKGEDSTQEELFSQVGKKVVETSIQGYNGTVFAYGQTGSGKTFTMNGQFSALRPPYAVLLSVLPFNSKKRKSNNNIH